MAAGGKKTQRKRQHVSKVATDDERRKNRAAAQRNRDRKKRYVEDLERELEQLAKEHAELTHREETLLASNRDISDKIRLINDVLAQAEAANASQQQQQQQQQQQSSILAIEGSPGANSQTTSPQDQTSQLTGSESAVLKNTSLPSELQPILTLLTLLTSVVTFLPSMSMISTQPSTSATQTGICSTKQDPEDMGDLYSEESDLSDEEDSPTPSRTGRPAQLPVSQPLSRTNSPPRARVKMEEPCCQGNGCGKMTSTRTTSLSSSSLTTSASLPTHQTVSQVLHQLSPGSTTLTTSSLSPTSSASHPIAPSQLSTLITALTNGAFHQVIDYITKNKLVAPSLLEQCQEAGACHNPAMLASLGSSMVPCC
jgi:uncharacterized protein YoxC